MGAVVVGAAGGTVVPVWSGVTLPGDVVVVRFGTGAIGTPATTPMPVVVLVAGAEASPEDTSLVPLCELRAIPGMAARRTTATAASRPHRMRRRRVSSASVRDEGSPQCSSTPPRLAPPAARAVAAPQWVVVVVTGGPLTVTVPVTSS